MPLSSKSYIVMDLESVYQPDNLDFLMNADTEYDAICAAIEFSKDKAAVVFVADAFTGDVRHWFQWGKKLPNRVPVDLLARIKEVVKKK